MSDLTVCVLHPGEMGAAVGRVARACGARVLWVAADRGPATRRRAEAAQFEEAATLAEGLSGAQFVVSVCPPHAAIATAQDVAAHRYRGIYVDANAVAPHTVRRIGAIVAAAGATFVDGGIVGPPPAPGASTRLYLAGSAASRVAELFAAGPLTATVLVDAPIGGASALKACYAAWTKGTAALLLAINALARHEGVAQALAAEWRLSQPDLFHRTDQATANARKAWRWIGEMEEIAATFGDADLPDGFHLAAAAVFRRLESFRDDNAVTLEDVVRALLPR